MGSLLSLSSNVCVHQKCIKLRLSGYHISMLFFLTCSAMQPPVALPNPHLPLPLNSHGWPQHPTTSRSTEALKKMSPQKKAPAFFLLLSSLLLSGNPYDAPTVTHNYIPKFHIYIYVTSLQSIKIYETGPIYIYRKGKLLRANLPLVIRTASYILVASP